MADGFNNAMRSWRWYVAGVVLTGLDFICHLTNHVGACWLSFRGPFKPLHDWAFDVLNPMPEPSPRPHFSQSSTLEIIRQGEGFTEARITFGPPSSDGLPR